jgi:hypothetical protein
MTDMTFNDLRELTSDEVANVAAGELSATDKVVILAAGIAIGVGLAGIGVGAAVAILLA